MAAKWVEVQTDSDVVAWSALRARELEESSNVREVPEVHGGVVLADDGGNGAGSMAD
jgi:hypothetical protein